MQWLERQLYYSEEERNLLQWLERQLYYSEEERSLLQWLERQLYSSEEERSLLQIDSWLYVSEECVQRGTDVAMV